MRRFQIVLLAVLLGICAGLLLPVESKVPHPSWQYPGAQACREACSDLQWLSTERFRPDGTKVDLCACGPSMTDRAQDTKGQNETGD